VSGAEVKEQARRTGVQERERVAASRRALRDPSELPPALGARLLLELGLKPVLRELHDAGAPLAEARARWEQGGWHTASGAVVREAAATAAKVSAWDVAHTVRPLARHPVIERLLSLGGPLAERVLLHPTSPVYRALCDRFGADAQPIAAADPVGPGGAVRERVALYVARRGADAAGARALDHMAADRVEGADTTELGRLLGYPPCCVAAYAALERRWPNRLPIAAAARATGTFLPRLNNLSLSRCHWVAHVPCRYDCAASAALADAAAGALAAVNPAIVAALDALLAAPRVYLDDDTQAILRGARWRGAGALTFEALVPLEVLWPGRGAPPGGAAWAAWAGADEVTWDGPVGRFTARGRRVGGEREALVLPFGL
jgi:hypothetical protein